MAITNFFPQTQNFEILIGDEISFTWACYCGLWKVHSEANKLNAHLDNINWKKAEKYLLGDVPNKGGIDLNRIAIKKTWIEHEVQFEQMMLLQMANLYEEWCVNFSRFIDPNLDRVAEVLQFPSKKPRIGLPTNHPTTWKKWLTKINQTQSNLIAADFRPTLLNLYSQNISNIDHLLYWFRFFKECRNAYIHNGGIHTQQSVSAYKLAEKKGLKSLGFSRDLSLSSPPVLNAPIQLGLQNAFFGLAVIGRLANAFDALLCHAKEAEANMISRLQSVALLKPERSIASSKQGGTERRIKSLLKSAYLPMPISLAGSEILFKSKGWIKF